MLDNSLKSVLDEKKISEALRENSAQKLGDKKRLYAIGDHCDIRKGHSRKLENIGKVRDLNGNLTNGYTTLGTVIVDENRKNITLADITVFSNKEERFISQKEIKAYESGKIEDKARVAEIKKFIDNNSYINMTLSVREQTKRVSKSLKEKNPDVSICHVHDRFCDSVEYFEHIDQTLNDEFVVRVKLSRNSNEKKIDANGKPKAIKLIDVEFANQKSYIIDKLRLKGKLYQQAKVLIEWDRVTLNKREYSVVRITLKKKNGESIHKKPMMLISNIEVTSYLGAKEIYHTYLLRSKIEAVFKFLKDVLGWEEFQVRDWDSIKNIIALCFFIGNYFYEIESALIHNPTIEIICQMGSGKGTVSRHFFLEGLKVMLITQNTLRLRRELEISDETWQEMEAFAGIGKGES
jgi:hypothetical protein